jgi:hypothetical protein
MNTDSVYIPTKFLSTAMITESTGQLGLIWPDKKHLPPALVTDWDGMPYAVNLAGDQAFKFFPIRLRVNLAGLLTVRPEFVVDVNSRYNATTETDPLGALVMKEGRLSLVGVALGDGFADPTCAPLWQTIEAGAPEVALGFTRWQLIVRDGERTIPVWSYDASAGS